MHLNCFKKLRILTNCLFDKKVKGYLIKGTKKLNEEFDIIKIIKDIRFNHPHKCEILHLELSSNEEELNESSFDEITVSKT